MSATPRPLAERFWEKVDTAGGLFACWPWQSTISGNGYGQFWLDGRYRPAHQVALELAGRPLGPGLQACHTCDTPLCVNPAHLFEGTVLDNARDRTSKGRSFRPIGELHPMAKLTAELVAEIRTIAAAGRSYREIADLFGVDPSTISLVVRRIRWAA